jgi:hypothetical protein
MFKNTGQNLMMAQGTTHLNPPASDIPFMGKTISNKSPYKIWDKKPLTKVKQAKKALRVAANQRNYR